MALYDFDILNFIFVFRIDLIFEMLYEISCFENGTRYVYHIVFVITLTN